MDLFLGPERDQDRLENYRNAPLLFTRFEASTCSVSGNLSGVNFNEERIIDCMECTGNIANIDCNFGHLSNPRFRGFGAVVRKSNRGRKKKERVRKPRKYQGDGSSFNSEITFSVISSHIRRVPLLPDKHSLHSLKLEGGLEKVTKPYKIKVFRNGSITVPGILQEDLSDLLPPLQEVCENLSEVLLTEIKPARLYSVMRNYKFRLLEGATVQIPFLQRYCEKHFHTLLNVRFSDIEDFLTSPALEEEGSGGEELSPLFEGWNEVFLHSEVKEPRISFTELYRSLCDSISTKNLYVDFEKLTQKLKTLPLTRVYQKLQLFWEVVNENFLVLDNSVYRKLLRFLLHPHLKELQGFLTRNGDNMLSHIKYDPEKYPGFLIKIKTPLPTDPNKKTTIKIFQSGKINIDGANSREEALFIYYWLNHLFYQNPEFMSTGSFNWNDHDPEFSSDSEED